MFIGIDYVKSSFPFLRSVASSRSLRIHASSFESLTATAVVLTSDPIERKLIEAKMEIKTQDSLEIKESKFRKIYSSENGGALQVSNKEAVVVIEDTGFQLCQSSNDGGACFIEASLVNFSGICFEGCRADSRGQALDIGGNEGHVCNIKQLSADQCSPLRSQGESVSLFIHNGVSNLEGLNSTRNHVKDLGAGLCVAHSHSLILRFSTFLLSSGENLIWFHNIKVDDQLTSCNVLENKVHSKTGLVVFEGSTAVLSGFVFIGNEASTYFMAGHVTLSQCFFDVKQKGQFIASCTVDWVESLVGQNRLKPREFPEFVTWKCMNLGAPSPTPSQSLVPIEAAAEKAVHGITVFAVLLVIGFLSGMAAYFMLGNAGEASEAQKLQALSPN